MLGSIGWKIMTAGALFIYALLIGAIILLVLRNPGLAVVAVPAMILLAYAGWLLFSGAGHRRRTGQWLMATSVVILVVELLLFIRDPANMRLMLIIVALAGLYAALVVILRNRYWHERRIGGTASGAASFHRPVLIINPKSGNGRAVKADIDSLARSQGIEVIMLQKGDDIESIARRAVRQGADMLGISGGDGSIGAVAKVALDSDLPLVVLPGGTRCHFARDIGLDPRRIGDALNGYSGVERRVDVGDINGRIFLNNVSFGLYADIVNRPEYRDNKLAVIREVMQAMANGTKALYNLRFHHGERRFDKAAQVLVAANRYQTMRFMELGRRERLDEGVLQVTAVTKLDDAMIRNLLRTVSIDRLRAQRAGSDMLQWDAESFDIASGGATIIAGVDGEREEFHSPARLRILPKALRLYVPAEGVRSRPKNIFSLFIADQLRHYR